MAHVIDSRGVDLGDITNPDLLTYYRREPGYTVGGVTTPANPARSNADILPAWAANTIYAAGQEILDPTGVTIIVRQSTGTSRATYDTTEQAQWSAAGAGGGGGGGTAATLVPTAVKTANYSAAASDFVPVDTTSGNVTVTLPTAPADKTQVGVKHVVRGGTNTVSIAAGGSDVFNKTGGSTTATLTLLNQGTVLQYKASGAIWYVVSDDLPLSQLPKPRVAVNVKDYGAVGDTVSRVDGNMTSGSAVLTAAGASFTAADVGKSIIVYQAATGPVDLITTIASYQSSTQVTLTANCTNSRTNKPFAYGTDDTAAITAARAALNLTGQAGTKVLYLPPGRYWDTAQRNFDLTDHVTVLGDANTGWSPRDLGSVGRPIPDAASELVYAGSAGPYISAKGSAGFALRGLGISYVQSAFTGTLVDYTSHASRYTQAPYTERVSFSANGGVLFAGACVDLRGIVVANFDHCDFGGATSAIVTSNGGWTMANAVTFRDCSFDQCGSTLINAGSGAITLSHWLFDGCVFEVLAGASTTQINLGSGQAITFQGCGFWDGSGQTWVTTAGTISGLSFIGCFVQGNSFFLDPGSATIDGLSVVACEFNNSATGTLFKTVNGKITNLCWVGNSLDANWTNNIATVGGIRHPNNYGIRGGISPKSTYYSVPPGTINYVTVPGGLNTMWAVPISCPVPLTLDRMGIWCSTGVASSVVRLGVYYDDGTGHPGALLSDAGTVATTATNNYDEITGLSIQLPEPGTYWFVAVSQGGASAAAFQCVDGLVGSLSSTTASDFTGGASTINGYTSGTSVAGALPATFGAATARYQGPRVLVRAK